MQIACAIACLLFGLFGLVGQLISTVDFKLAQRLGLQEPAEDSDPLYSRLELQTARWDLAVLWTLPLAGVLMLTGATIWPYVALVAGGLTLDTGGREIAKVVGIKAHGLRVGGERANRLALRFLFVLAAIGGWAIVTAAVELAGAG